MPWPFLARTASHAVWFSLVRTTTGHAEHDFSQEKATPCLMVPPVSPSSFPLPSNPLQQLTAGTII